MSEKFVLVEHSSAINTIIQNIFQTTQRIKFTAFDVSPKYIIFGATSGGIYIFTREPCQFLKLIPSTHGPTNLLRISPDQENLAVAITSGLVIVLEGCFNNHFEQQVFTEHEGHTVTALKWNGNELYCGDSTGRVSVITLKSFLTKAMFQTPVACLMHLDSQIVQLDTFSKFLLVSTQTRTLLCDTETERYRQIGKKMRDGLFGACFLSSGVVPDVANTSRSWGVFKTVSETEQLSGFAGDANVTIYCARPGVRLWQADFQGNVVFTHQFRGSLAQKQSDFIEWSERDELKVRCFEGANIGEGFNFGAIFPLDKFIVTFKDDGFYIFEPSSSTLTHWNSSISNIKDIRIVDSMMYIWHNDLEVNVLGFTSVEELILRSLFRKKYNLCGDLCVRFLDHVENLISTSKKIYLISALETKLEKPEVLAQLAPIFENLKEKAKVPSEKTNGIVTVNALPLLPEPVQNFQDPLEEPLSIFSEQFKISKIHKNIETSDFIRLMQSLNSQSLFELVTRFQTPETASWCQDIFLKHVNPSDIPSDSLEYACEAFLRVNHYENLLCKCNFPLPRAHQTVPKYYDLGCKLMEKSHACDLFLKNVPYMYKTILTDLTKLPLMIQFSDPTIIEVHSKDMAYDIWDESTKLLIKLKSGQCLNCESHIDPSNSLKWTTFGVLMIESIKPTNAIKLLKRYFNQLPKGELDQFFYQYCILATVRNVNSKLKETLQEENVQEQFENAVGGFLRRKYLQGGDYFDPPSHKSTDVENCDHCHLPLKAPILEELKKLTCGHNYHQVCFLYNKNHCPVCNKFES